MKFLSDKDKNILRWSYKYIKNYRVKLYYVVISIILLILITTIEPILRAKFISTLFIKDTKILLTLLTLLSLIYCLQILINYIKSKMLINLDNNITNDLKKDMFRNIINLPVKAFDDINIGELMSRMNGDVQALSNIFTNYLFSLLSDALTVVFVGFSMIKLNYILFLIVVITCPITWIMFKIYGKKLRKQGKQLKEANDKSFSKTQQSFSGIKEIISLGIKKRIVSDMDSVLDDMNEKTIKYSIISMRSNVLAYFINSLDKILFMVIGTILILNNKITVEIFIAFLSYSTSFSASLSNLTQMNAVIQQFLVSLERIFDLNNNLSYENVQFGNIKLEELNGSICFKDVSFAYTKSQDAVKNISIEIDADSKVGIVGESGSGKSTIFNLLLRFYDNYNGDITIDGHNIRQLSEKTIRKYISVVMQETYLFNLSIRENLCINNPEATMDQIIDVCKKCNIHDYIMSLPKGYDTYVAEGGGNFSSGQNQRISIARSVLQNAKIILFDEVTSSLDNESQHVINELIDYISEDHTVIVIAHRLKTVMNADKIILLNNGVVAGCGKHEELLSNNNKYRELFLHENFN